MTHDISTRLSDLGWPASLPCPGSMILKLRFGSICRHLHIDFIGLRDELGGALLDDNAPLLSRVREWSLRESIACMAETQRLAMLGNLLKYRDDSVLSIWSNRLCAMEVKRDENKLGRRMPLCYDNAIDAVSLLHSLPWSLEPCRAIVNIHMLSTPVQGGTVPP